MKFQSEKINKILYRIKDELGVAMYLVVGNKKCLLIDTGYGILGLKDFIQTLCELPMMVCLSHGHIDHALGAGEFDEVYMNQEDIECYRKHVDDQFRRDFIRLFFPNQNVKLIPAYKHEFLSLEDGMTFDLGDVHVDAISTPGHTMGTMMFLIKEDRSIIFGDGCGPGTLLLEDFSSDVSTYLTSLKKIKEIEHTYDRIYRFHGTCVSDKCLLDNVIKCCEDILQGKDKRIKIIGQEALSLLNPLSLATYMAKVPECEDGNISYREDKVK